jgi:hypothetical protein
MTEDEQLLSDYSKEVYGVSYGPENNLTVSQLIESHKTLREKFRVWNGERSEASRLWYEQGYGFGVKNAAENTIMLEDLRKMSVQEFVNLIGSDDF